MALSILRLDMRAPAFSPATPKDLYAAALEMSSWADEKGFLTITVSEHHGSEDGYLPSPLVMSGLILGRTRRVNVSVMALIVPLTDPIRLAEEIAVLDIASGGRLMVAAGMGYLEDEYLQAGLDWKRRGKLMDESIEKMLRAWSDEPVEHNGAVFQVTPKPLTKPHPLLFVGGGSPAAARRAARFHLPFAPQKGDPALVAAYEAECERLGFDGGFVAHPGEGIMTIVCEDPDRTWAEVGRYILHDTRIYAEWGRKGGVSSAVTSHAESVDEIRATGKFQVLTPEECIAKAKADGPLATFVHFPLVGGAPPEIGWKSLQLYGDKVLPYIE